MKLGEAIKLLRQKKGISARSLSVAARLSPSYVSKVECGEIEPSLKAFGRLAQELNMTTQEILYLVFIEARS